MAAAAGLLAACLLALLPNAFSQVIPANVPSTQLCNVPEEQVRVLATTGFSRGVLQPYTATTFDSSPGAGAPAPAPPAITSLQSCLFLSFDPEFETLLGDNATLMQVGPYRAGQTWAVETPAWLPETDELVFASAELMPPSTISRLNLQTGEVVTVPVHPPAGNLGGSSYYQGDVIVAGLGDATDDANPPSIIKLDPVNGNYTVLLNNFFGQRFGGFDDLIAMKDGSILATDTNYTTIGMPAFKNVPTMPRAVWILPPTGPPRQLISWVDLPVNPNGLSLSEDEKTLYVSVAPLTVNDPVATAAVNQLFAFDLLNINGGYFATGRRVFATSDYGFYDGIKVDGNGYFYGSCDDGVQIFNPAGTLIGKILVPQTDPIQGHPTNAIGFAGNRLIIMQQTNVLVLQLNTTSAAFVSNE